jgi:two-component SAPR family response regulator
MRVHDFSHVPKVLVIEEQFIIALALFDALKEIGLRPVGPVATVDEALSFLREDAPDAALLDI